MSENDYQIQDYSIGNTIARLAPAFVEASFYVTEAQNSSFGSAKMKKSAW
jgi:hypothetical protein